MTVGVWINQIWFSGGEKINLNRDDIVVFVGPNNAGKTEVLRGLFNKLKDADLSNTYNRRVHRIEISSSWDKDERAPLHQWLEQVLYTQGDSPEHYSGMGFYIHADEVSKRGSPAYFKEHGLGDLANVFAHFLDTQQRLELTRLQNSIDPFLGNPSHPIHYLQLDEQIEAAVSSDFKDVFGKNLIVGRCFGPNLPIFIGDMPKYITSTDRASSAYRSGLLQLDPLHYQGDGVRGLVSILLMNYVPTSSVLFIDEPECFLHPHQARRLGKLLVERRRAGRQIFISTHSGDFLRGMLDAGTENKIRVIRLTREGRHDGAVNEIDTSVMSTVWNDPLLRYSNILDGMFHKAVILCEADGDCRFFHALTDAICDVDQIHFPDVMFVHCGGKDRIPVVVNALRAIGVPVRVVPDFDFLKDAVLVRKVFEGLGGQWETIKNDLSAVTKDIEGRYVPARSEEIISKIRGIIDRVVDDAFPRFAKKEIVAVLNALSSWNIAKDVGASILPSGDVRSKYKRLCVELEAVGIFLIDVGTLEKFVPSVGGHGPKWVAAALSKDLHSDPELEVARNFVRALVRSLETSETIGAGGDVEHA